MRRRVDTSFIYCIPPPKMRKGTIPHVPAVCTSAALYYILALYLQREKKKLSKTFPTELFYYEYSSNISFYFYFI